MRSSTLNHKVLLLSAIDIGVAVVVVVVISLDCTHVTQIHTGQ